MAGDIVYSCDLPGCDRTYSATNNWFAVQADGLGRVCIYRWEYAKETRILESSKHFCGVGHTIQHVSNLLTPNTTDPNRESTLELKPPLTRDGAETETKEEGVREGQ